MSTQHAWGGKHELPSVEWFRDNFGDHVNSAGRELLAMLLAERSKVASLEAKLAGCPAGNCGWCDAEIAPDGTAPERMRELFREHMKGCAEHPVHGLEADLARLASETDGLRASLTETESCAAAQLHEACDLLEKERARVVAVEGERDGEKKWSRIHDMRAQRVMIQRDAESARAKAAEARIVKLTRALRSVLPFAESRAEDLDESGAGAGADSCSVIELARAALAVEASIASGKAPESEPLFFVQDTRQVVGNCALWWRPDGAGYTINLDEAGTFPASFKAALRPTDVMRPCDEVERLAQRHVTGDVMSGGKDVAHG